LALHVAALVLEQWPLTVLFRDCASAARPTNLSNPKTTMKITALLTAALICGSAAFASAADAKANWDQHCAKCHGADGKGKTKMGEKVGARDLTDAKVKAELKDEAAFKAIKEGMTKEGKTLMKAFGGTLSDDEIKALVEFSKKL
jgi:mono/diheme cytochrome c family protein